MKKTEAVKPFGTQDALAKALGIPRSTVYQWREDIPKGRVGSVRLAIAERARQLEAQAVQLRQEYGV